MRKVDDLNLSVKQLHEQKYSSENYFLALD